MPENLCPNGAIKTGLDIDLVPLTVDIVAPSTRANIDSMPIVGRGATS